jgi:hypothetical protein
MAGASSLKPKDGVEAGETDMRGQGGRSCFTQRPDDHLLPFRISMRVRESLLRERLAAVPTVLWEISAPVRGEKDDGCQSFALGAIGQTLIVSSPVWIFFSSTC